LSLALFWGLLWDGFFQLFNSWKPLGLYESDPAAYKIHNEAERCELAVQGKKKT
jgi:hypothetical protein